MTESHQCLFFHHRWRSKDFGRHYSSEFLLVFSFEIANCSLDPLGSSKAWRVFAETLPPGLVQSYRSWVFLRGRRDAIDVEGPLRRRSLHRLPSPCGDLHTQRALERRALL